MLCWFDEPVELLEQAVRSAYVLADRIVAADGAYKLVPDAKARSPKEQKAAIKKTAENLGMKVQFLTPRIWEGQVAKRDAVLQEAAKGSDWVFPIDADWQIIGERDEVRESLERLLSWPHGCDQVLVNFIQPPNEHGEAANVWHEDQARLGLQYLPVVYRTFPVMHYFRHHWVILCIDENGRQLGLFGGAGYGKFGAPVSQHIGDRLTIRHLCLFREAKQVQRNRVYINKRDHQVELQGFET